MTFYVYKLPSPITINIQKQLVEKITLSLDSDEVQIHKR